MGKGQTYSMDLVIGMLIFLLAIGTIYSLLGSQANNDISPLRIESEVIATELTSPVDTGLQVASDNQLNMNQLVALAGQDYEALKEQLGVTNEFCIYLQDNEGNLVYIRSDLGGNEYTGVGPGSNELKLSGVECGKVK